MATNLDSGRVELEVALVHHASTVTGAYATNPMKLLAPRSRGLSAWAYTSSFGGGMVAGDQTRLDLRICSGARCFLGTQSATKIYRNPASQPCTHVTRAVLEAGSFLTFMPAPLQPFADSTYSQQQTFHLAPSARLVLLDWFTAGRVACGERWAFTQFSTRNEVFVETQSSLAPARDPGWAWGNGHSSASRPANPAEPGLPKLVFLDSLSLDAGSNSLRSPHRTGRFNCFAMLLLLGTGLRREAEQLLAAVRRRPVERRASLLVIASTLEHGALLRVAGEQVEKVEAELQRHLGFLDGLLGGLPWSRRW
jgi:urease accessory protein